MLNTDTTLRRAAAVSYLASVVVIFATRLWPYTAAVEGNPAMAWVITHAGYPAFAALKLGTVAVVFTGLWWLSYRDLPGARAAALAGAGLFTLMTAGNAIHDLALLARVEWFATPTWGAVAPTAVTVGAGTLLALTRPDPRALLARARGPTGRKAGAAVAALFMVTSAVTFGGAFIEEQTGVNPSPVGTADAAGSGSVEVITASNWVNASDADGNEIWTYNVGGANKFTTMDVAASSSKIFVAGDTSQIVALDVSDGTKAWNFTTPSANIRFLTVSPDGSTVYAGAGNGKLWAVDASDGSEKWSDGTIFSNKIDGLDIGPDGDYLYVASRDGYQLKKVAVSDRSVSWTADPPTASIGDVVAGPDGNSVYSGWGDNIYVNSTADGSSQDSKNLGANAVDIALEINSDGSTLFAGPAGRLQSRSVSDLSLNWQVGNKSNVRSLALGPDGDNLAVGWHGTDGTDYIGQYVETAAGNTQWNVTHDSEVHVATVSGGGGQSDIEGTVVTEQGGTPVGNASVLAVGVVNNQITQGTFATLNDSAEDILARQTNATPAEFNRSLSVTDDKLRETSQLVPVVNLESDWGEQNTVNIPTVQAATTAGMWPGGGHISVDPGAIALPTNPDLSDPVVEVPAEEPLVIHVRDPSKSAFFEDSVDGDLPGLTVNETVYIQELSPTGEDIGDPMRVRLYPTFQTNTGKTHYAVQAALDTGYYELWAAGARGTSYAIQVGDSEDIFYAFNKRLRDKANNKIERAKTLQNYLSNGTIVKKQTTAKANGSFSIDFPSGVHRVKVTAWKGPQSMANPRNATREEILDYYEGLIPESGRVEEFPSVYTPTKPETAAIPSRDMEVEVREQGVPDRLGLAASKNFTDDLLDLLDRIDYSDLPAAVQDYIERNLNRQQLERLMRAHNKLCQQSETLRHRAEAIRGQDICSGTDGADGGEDGGFTGPLNPVDTNQSDSLTQIARDNGTIINIENATNTTLIESIAAVQQALNQLPNTVDSGDPTSDVDPSQNTVSLGFPFDTELTPENVIVTAHFSNGTSEVLPVHGEHVEIDKRAGRGDVVRIVDYPLGSGDAAVADFEVDVVSDQGNTGTAKKAVTNPTFSGTVGKLDAISLSTLRPGPNDTVNMTVHPADGVTVDNVTDVTVFGPNGEVSNVDLNGPREAAFKTNGEGQYHVRVKYEDNAGNPWEVTYRVEAGEWDTVLPPEIRTVRSPQGRYALVGDGLANGEVDISEGGQAATLVAQLDRGQDVPSTIRVHTAGLDLEPDQIVEVRVVEGPDRAAISERVTIDLHAQRVPEDGLVWVNGDPAPRDGQSGVVQMRTQSNGTRAVFPTAPSGVGTYRVNAAPSFFEQLTHTVLSFDLPLLATGLPALPSFPTLPSGPPVAGQSLLGLVVGAGLWRRRGQLR